MSTPAVGLSQTALDILKSSLRLCRVLDPKEEPDGDEANQALVVLNQFLDGLDADALGFFTKDIKDFAFTPGQQTYTLGTSYTDADGNVQTPDWDYGYRPATIERMSAVLSSSGIELPINYSTLEADWQAVLLKTVSTTYPWFCYDTSDHPFRSLNFYPVPKGNSARIYAWQPLTKCDDLTTTIWYPPAYAEMVRYNLALRLNGEFGGEMAPDDKRMALQMLANVKASNVEVAKLLCDDAWSFGSGTAYTGSDIPPNY